MNKLVIEQIATMCHAVNKAWCELNGDTSQPDWDDAPSWQKESAINGVTFHLDNPDAGDSASHDNWMAEKLDAGWEYGEFKDPDANPPTHHCLVPFHELPQEQQIKDKLFRSTIHSIVHYEDFTPREEINPIKESPQNFFSFEEAIQLFHAGATDFIFRNTLGEFNVAYRDSNFDGSIQICEWKPKGKNK